MKEIIKIQVDKELDMTEVMIGVPNFQNFGQRLSELERKSAEAVAEAPPDLETISTATAKLNALMEKSLKAMPEGPQKEMILKMMKETADASGKDEDEDIEQEESSKEFEHDLQQLTVSIPTSMKWNSATEAMVDQFLVDWPKNRPVVLKATAKYYKEQYADVMEYLGDEPGVEFILPNPGAPEVVADLFRISTIYLRDDGGIGLSGHCTWDDEHGYGVVLKNGRITAVGHASEAFD